MAQQGEATNIQVEKAPLIPHSEHEHEEKAPTCFQKYNPLSHGSMAASGFNLASATLGAGTLALPAAFAASGSVLGAILLILCAASTVYSINLLMKTAEKTKLMTYEQMSRELIGKRWDYVTEFMIVIFCWGITIVYVVMIGSILDPLRSIHGFPEVFQGSQGLRIITAIFWGLFMLPLSLCREINTLRYASAVGISSTFVLMGSVVAHAASGSDATITANHTSEPVGRTEMDYARFDMNMIMALPIIIFSFCCQTNSFEIYTELAHRSVKRMTLASTVSMSVCTLIYIVTGVAGYYDFGQKVHGNILKNYHPVGTPYLAVAFIAISITLTMAFPICIFPTRDAILQLLGYKDAYSTPARVRIAICAALATTSLIVGLFCNSVRVLFSLLGGICGSYLSFVLPAVFALRSGGWTVENVGWLHVILTWTLLIAGIIAGVVGTVVPIIQMAT